MSLVVTNLRHVGAVIGGCNAIGFLISAVFETHKITDLVGVGSFVAAAMSLTFRNAALVGGLGRQKVLSLTVDNARVFLVNAGVVLWGTRLSTYLFHRVLKLGEDTRLHAFYREKGESYLELKRSFYPVKLASFWTIQALWGYICMLPVTLLNSVPAGTAAAVVDKLKYHNDLSLRWRGPVSACKLRLPVL
jgi:steroid 5-alpha reductase family enzyme